ncbi:CHC2 zinc finger domain-containing protein [uncultured Sphaerochaeta sp.]|uniref:DNA primase n=1 Tax=uncultured Sphaerochaeta sp. TaxID=886478 RepID=UPI0026303DAE|nr:CHC2 zinc finger domain-containing protein [uncultured Sphaerochaeta sp.]
MIPDEIVKEIYARTNILEIISDYVSLKKRGKDWFGFSPFNLERTPSFSVTPDRGLFYDFSANIGGNAASFLMHMERVSYPQALRMLADYYKIKIPDGGYVPPVEFDVVGYFQQLWHNQLLSDASAMDYLINNRGISIDTIVKFGIGVSRQSVSTTKDRVFSAEEKISAGMMKSTDRGMYDPFINRITIPIRDDRGRTRGFTARIFEDGDTRHSKYLNNSDTNIFNKGEMVMGLTENRKHMRGGTALVVEGGIDVIGLDSSGILNSTGTLGTSLTRQQITKIMSSGCDYPTIWRDSGRAGRKSTADSTDKFLEVGIFPHIMTCPEGHDPDSIRRAVGFSLNTADLYGVEKFDNFLGYYRNIYDSVGTFGAKKSVFSRMCKSISCLPSDIDRNLWIKEAASVFSDASEDDIRNEIGTPKRQGVFVQNATPMQKIRISDEYHILLVLVKHGDTETDEYGMTVLELFKTLKGEIWDKAYDQISKEITDVEFSHPGFTNPDLNIILQAIINPRMREIHSVLYEGMPGTVWAAMLYETPPPLNVNDFLLAFQKKTRDIMNRWVGEVNKSKDLETVMVVKRWLKDNMGDL